MNSNFLKLKSIGTLLVLVNLSNTVLIKAENLKQLNNKIDIEYLYQREEDDYILGPRDRLIIRISRDYPELTNIALVNGEGTINIPKLNKIYVEGLTISELTNLLNKAYLEFVKYPNIEVEILEYRPVNILVKGEVNRPGQITLEGSLSSNDSLNLPIQENAIYKQDYSAKVNHFYPTLFDAIRESGGINIYSDLSRVELIRLDTLSNGSGKKKTEINFIDAMKKGDTSKNIRIYDGDIIDIKKNKNPNSRDLQKLFENTLNSETITVQVSGRVLKPGIMTLQSGATLNEAILIAGGSRVLKGKTRYISYENNGNLDVRTFKYSKRNKRGSFKNPYLKQGDIIIIERNIISASTEVISEVTSPFTSILSTYGLIKAISE